MSSSWIKIIRKHEIMTVTLYVKIYLFNINIFLLSDTEIVFEPVYFRLYFKKACFNLVRFEIFLVINFFTGAGIKKWNRQMIFLII